MQYCETLCCASVVVAANTPSPLCATCRLGRLNVVLDLDETLVHGEHKCIEFDDCEPFVCFDDLNVYKRPHVDLFLNAVFAKYNVYIWTAARASYAKVVLSRLLSSSHVPLRVLTRRDTLHIKPRDRFMYACREDSPVKIKPLTKLGCNLARTVMIDDTRSSFSRNATNGILIEPFHHPEEQCEDRALLLCLDALAVLADLDDVRTYAT